MGLDDVDELLQEVELSREGCVLAVDGDMEGQKKGLMSDESSAVFPGYTYTYCLSLTFEEEGLGPGV